MEKVHSELTWVEDPKHVLFTLSRYKFVSRMLHGYKKVLEVGCGDGIPSRIVGQEVVELELSDIVEVRKTYPYRFYRHDILVSPLHGYDAVYCLDVFEHIKDEDRLLINLGLSAPVVIIGTPSLESQKYASKRSLEQHVNCKSGNDFKNLLKRHYNDVFLFSMNDEVVHTGFYPMAHYLMALCLGKSI